MKVNVAYGEKVVLSFEGSVNMSQSVELSKEDAAKLGKILLAESSESFETA